jgi:hypothetical protein
LAQPTAAYLLNVLDALTPQNIEELSLWQLRNEHAEGIANRITTDLGEHRNLVRNVLSDFLRLDLWGDHECCYPELQEQYAQSGVQDAEIEKTLGRPPKTYSFLLHGCIGQWKPTTKRYGITMIIEDDSWCGICSGFLIAKRRAFSTKVALLESSMREEWRGWRELWKWF